MARREAYPWTQHDKKEERPVISGGHVHLILEAKK